MPTLLPPTLLRRGLLAWAACVGLFLGGGVPPVPQTPPMPEPPSLPAIRLYGSREGLPNATVQALVKDRDGRIWIATQDGIAVFNGRRWRQVPLPPESRSNYIRTLTFDAEGSLWAGTQDDGLWRRREGRWEVVELPVKPARPRINWLLATRSGGRELLWVCTGGAGLLQGEPERDGRMRWTVLDKADGLPSPWVWSIRPGSGGVLWITTDEGVARLEQGRVQPVAAEGPAPGRHPNECLEVPGPEGAPQLWVSYWGDGLAALEGGRWRQVPFPSRYPISLARTRAPDGQPILWVGTNDAGLFWRKGQGPWRNIGPGRGLPSRGVYGLLANGDPPDLWIGMRDGGVATLCLGAFTGLQSAGLADPHVNAVLDAGAEGAPPCLLLGTDEGLSRLCEEKLEVLPALNRRLPNPQVYALALTGAFGGRRLAVGTLGGLLITDGPEGGKTEVFDAGHGLPDNDVRCLLAGHGPDGAEALWVGTSRGLACASGGRWTLWRDELPGPMVYTLLETKDEDGGWSLWAGTRGGGLGRFRHGQWTRYGLAEGLPNLSVYALAAAKRPDGRPVVWAGTFGGGLASLDPERPGARWEPLPAAQAPDLAGKVVLGMLAAPGGRLYVSTPGGVLRVNPSDWTVETFTEGEGLPNRLCTRGLALDREGRVWVGTVAGAAVLDPATERALPPPPRPLLERVTAADKELPVPDSGVDPTASLVLSHRQQPLAFEFALASYVGPEETRFRTQLVGLEEGPGPWSAEGRRDLGFLPQGSYRLRVEARDARGRISAPLEIPFTVRPAPWRHPLAYLAYALAALAAGFIYHRLRVRLLRDRNRELRARVDAAVGVVEEQKHTLERLNGELTKLSDEKSRMLGIAAHDLRNPLNAIILYADLLKGGDADPETAEVAEKIQKRSHDMAELINRLLDVTAIEAGRLEFHPTAVPPARIAEALAETHGPRATAKGIHLELEVPRDLPELRADPFYLRQILDNLLSNALKFSHKGHAVTVAAGPGWFEVRDQGPGFTEEDKAKLFGRFTRLSARPTGGEASTGLGLSIVKQQVEAMGGAIELESQPGHGATFRVTLPVVKGGGRLPG